MADEGYYLAPDSEKVRQGDIVALAPMVWPIRPPPWGVLNSGQEKNERRKAQHGRPSTWPRKRLQGADDVDIVVTARLRWAMLLTRGCDVDKGRRQRQLAPIRPLSTISSEDDQLAVVEGRAVGLHYIPPVPQGLGSLFGHAYVDFRGVTTLHADLFDELERPLSVTRGALQEVYLAWVTHATGRRLSIAASCPHCGKPVPLLVEARDQVRPDEDY